MVKPASERGQEACTKAHWSFARWTRRHCSSSLRLGWSSLRGRRGGWVGEVLEEVRRAKAARQVPMNRVR